MWFRLFFLRVSMEDHSMQTEPTMNPKLKIYLVLLALPPQIVWLRFSLSRRPTPSPPPPHSAFCACSPTMRRQVAAGMFAVVGVIALGVFMAKRRQRQRLRGEFQSVPHRGLNEMDNL